MTGPAIFLRLDPRRPDQGANNLQRSPVDQRQRRRSTVEGTGTAGATVEVYRASRAAGQSWSADCVPGHDAVVAGNGTWSMPATPRRRRRVTALQILDNGNTLRWAPTSPLTSSSRPHPPVADFTGAQQAGDARRSTSPTPRPDRRQPGAGTSATASARRSRTRAHTYAAGATTSSSSRPRTRAVRDTAPRPSPSTPADGQLRRRRSSSRRSTTAGAPPTSAAPTRSNGTRRQLQRRRWRRARSACPAPTSRARRCSTASARPTWTSASASPRTRSCRGQDLFVYAVARRNGNSEYRPRLILNANGTVSVSASVLATAARARSAARSSCPA